MTTSVHSEDFEITPAIRDHAIDTVSEIDHFVKTRDDTDISVFLKKQAAHVFSATIRAHIWGRNLIASETGPDLYRAIDRATKHLVRRINHLKGRTMAMKRKAPPNFLSELV